MLVTLISNGNIYTSSLPDEPSGMHWISDSGNHDAKRLGFIEAKDGVWMLSPKKGIDLFDGEGKEFDRIEIDPLRESDYRLRGANLESMIIIRPETDGDKSYEIIGFSADVSLTIGSDASNLFTYSSELVSNQHARIDLVRDRFSVIDCCSTNGTFVNGKLLEPHVSRELNHGDIVQIIGLVIVAGNRFIYLNDPSDAVLVNATDVFVPYQPPPFREPETLNESDEEEIEYFYPSPRFKRDIHSKSIVVDAPPAKEKPDETPIAVKIGPSMVMAFAAVFSASFMVTNILDSGGSMMRAAPMMIMAVSMLTGAVLWPIINRRYQNKKAKTNEEKRRSTYASYLDGIRLGFQEEAVLQKSVLEENRIPLEECARRALEKDPQLMDRTPAHDDFLELRLGIGTVDMQMDIRFPDEHFSMESDDLTDIVNQLAKEPREIFDAPLAVSLQKDPILGIAGIYKDTRDFVFGLVCQLATLHSYEDVKVVILCNKEDVDDWSWTCSLPHAYNDTRSMRFLATSLEETAEIGLIVERHVEMRRELRSADPMDMIPHFVVICASKYLADKSEFVNNLAKQKEQRGVYLVTLAAEPKDLPKQCISIIEVARDAASIRAKADKTGKSHSFIPDVFLDQVPACQIMRALNEVRLDLASERGALPTSVDFFEMFEAGNLEQLNVRARWQEAKASTTLATPVGVDPQGQPFQLNLHERFHGPHGLIAGTTGSGKSEYIITWILSMCVSYSPEEAAFVLIDYKGGGLAGAFDNDRARLPHLAGTITNLDGAAINRSLVSIKSELKRRQALFNRAREAAGGDNVDIYRYLELYKQGKMAEPCPHLFIVADEFAELKQQEPEFMDELISAARIGRSLGVHLVLATQKPSGVVNDQIWSNAKFKVCLKVADKADSTEMIKRPDAAEITQAGRFYLLVGYNEYFAMGQSAYTGAPYVPKDQYVPNRDDSVAMLCNTGRPILSLKPESDMNAKDQPAQLVAILSHIQEIAQQEQMSAEQLWLDPIPSDITIDGLAEKYERSQENSFELNPILGELDDPANQDQHLLTLPLTKEGNAIFYGAPDAGVESLVSSLVYDLVKTHTPDELNAYLFDFGSEALTSFRGLPHVGDVILAAEEEKVSRAFDMLEAEMKERRTLFAPYGGSFERYCAKKGDKPAIVVVLNGVAVFSELYERFDTRLIALARDGIRSGVYLILVASNTTEVRMRLRANFKQSLACGLADESEYLNVFGTMRGVIVPEGFGRGLIKLEDMIYEFQGARILEGDQDEYSYIQAIGEELSILTSSRARRIPVLPDVVDREYLNTQSYSGFQIPLGVHEDNLEIAMIDFEDKVFERCLYSKQKDGLAFMKELMSLSSLRDDFETVLIDASKQFVDLPGICDRETQDDIEAINLFDTLLDYKESPPEKPLLIFISGIAGLMLRSDPIKANTAKIYLKHLRTHEGALFILFDAVQDATYSIEDWFKTQISNKDGIWISEGLDSQTAIAVTYGIGERIDPQVKGAKGYVVTGGKIRKTKLLSKPSGKQKG